MTLLFSGCATSSKLSDKDRAALAGVKHVRVLYYGNPYPTVLTASGVLATEMTLGLSAFAEDWTVGQKMMKKYNIANPPRTVRDRFLRQIKRESNIRRFVGRNAPANYNTERKIKDLQKKYKTGMVIQIFPGIFQIQYFATNWNRYQLLYGASAQMVRLDDGKVL